MLKTPTEKLEKQIEEIKDNQGLGWSQTLAYLNTVGGKLEEISAEYKEEVEAINQKAKQSQKDITDLQIRLNDSLQKLEETQTGSAETGELKKAAEKLQQQIGNQNQELKTLRAAKEKLELSLQEAQNQQKASEQLQNEVETKQKEASELQNRLDQAQKTEQQLKQEIAVLEERGRSENDLEKELLKKELASKKKALEDAQNNVKLLEGKRNGLNEEVKRLQAALIKKSQAEGGKVTELKEQLAGLQSKLDQEKTEKGKLTKRVEDFEKESISLRDQLAGKNLENQNLQGQLTAQNEKGKEKDTNIVRLENDLKQKGEELKKVEGNKNQLEKEREQLKNEKAELLKTSQADQEKLTKLEQQLAAQQTQIKKFEQEQVDANGQKNKITDLEGEIARLKRKIKDQENQIKQLLDGVDVYEEQIRELKQEIFNLKNTKSEELEAAQKRLTDYLLNQSEKKDEIVKGFSEEEKRQLQGILNEYSDFARKGIESCEGLIKITRNSVEIERYKKAQREYQAKIENIDQNIIPKFK